MRTIFAVLCAAVLGNAAVTERSAALAAPPGLVASGSGADARIDSLTLYEALRRAQGHPSLAALDLEAEARDALARQAGRVENPRLSLEAENFAGTGAFAGLDGLETTARLEQSIPLGGKLSLRRRQAEAEARLARGERAFAARELERAVREAFMQVLGAQRREALAVHKSRVLNEAAHAVERRRAAGGGQPADALKLSVERSRAGQERAHVAALSAVARARLAALTGDTLIVSVQGDFEALPPVPAWDAARAGALRHPDLARFAAERAARAASLSLARAQRVPDLDVTAGVRRVNAPGGGDVAVVGGISLPLPVWNRNTGGVAHASLRLSALEREAASASRAREAEVRALWTTLNARRAEIDRLREEILPDASRAADAAREAWLAGRHSVLEMLDGQRLLFEVNEYYLEALAAWHRDRAELDALAGLRPQIPENQP